MSLSDYNINIHIDRYDDAYKQELKELLSIDSLIANAETIRPGENYFNTYKKRVSIKFIGLSGLTIFGGTEFPGIQRTDVVDSFLHLIANRSKQIDILNRNEILIDVKILFAYPYSDFMYDLLQAENSRQDGFSMECILKNKNFDVGFRVSKDMNTADLKDSLTFKNLKDSLNKIQIAVNESRELFNNENHGNRLVIKLTPLNILNCFLKINHTLYIDPYVYSKEEHTKSHLGLIAPISKITIPTLPSFEESKKLDKTDKKILDHYCSLISHFRYIWQHPLTMYSTDATMYDKGVNGTLSKIKKPYEISFLSKAMRLQNKTTRKSQLKPFEIDLWKQHCKNELLKYCSKFSKKKDSRIGNFDKNSLNLKPIPIFIVGAWKFEFGADLSDTNVYMIELKKFINRYFGDKNVSGLRLQPIVVDAEDGTKIQEQVFKHLNSSQLGLVIQTSDYDLKEIAGNSRPNIYFERGYLMGRLGKRLSRIGEEKEMVFVFKEIKAIEGSDFGNISHTEFSTLNNFKIQFFRIVKWLWDMTELNSEFALNILRDYNVQLDVLLKPDPNDKFLLSLKRKNEEFIEKIQRWEKDYQNRMHRLSDI